MHTVPEGDDGCKTNSRNTTSQSSANPTQERLEPLLFHAVPCLSSKLMSSTGGDGYNQNQDWLEYMDSCYGEAVERQEALDLERQWENVLWHLTRCVKAYFEGTAVSKEEAFIRVDAWVRAQGSDWSEMFQNNHGAAYDATFARFTFFECWDKIKYLPGETAIIKAHKMARRHPLHTPDGLKWPSLYGDRDEFLSLAYWLQVEVGPATIQLPCDELGVEFGTCAGTISLWRRWALKEGYLREVRAYKRPSAGMVGRSTDFRFDLTKFPEMKP